MYIKSYLKYSRRKTITVQVGSINIGGSEKLLPQTMANTLTSDVTATALQAIKAYSFGSKLFRITIPSMKDIESLVQIKEYIKREGYEIPLVADIHFNQRIAFEAARVVDKIRINPGNFADNKKFAIFSYSEEEYKNEIQRVKDQFIPLLELCNKYQTAIRIGTNHGSLSDRIMSRFGDTPEGMAESAMEFLRICKEYGFNRVVISIKASNTRVMVQATRLLVDKMCKEDMQYPIHLGVTEAGEGEDGRIKSAVGIGTLLADGIGDTIRVSLTEPPENEMPVCKTLIEHVTTLNGHQDIADFGKCPVNPYTYTRRHTSKILNIGGNQVPVVVGEIGEYPFSSLIPEYIFDPVDKNHLQIIKDGTDLERNYELFTYSPEYVPDNKEPAFIQINCKDLTLNRAEIISKWKNKVLILESLNRNRFADFRAALFRLMNSSCDLPVIVKATYKQDRLEDLQIKASAELGGLFIDGLCDGIWINNQGKIDLEEVLAVSFGILQATRTRMIKPDYISCPSCGRTMFNLQETTRKIREKTVHLKGLKIGIMGCIVNGLGEMADADYGYIGAGIGKVNLYYNKELIKRGIPEIRAVSELIELIKEKGDWIEP